VKALGIAIHRLRAAVAHSLDLFRVCLRMGWIGNHPKRYTGKPVRRPYGKKGVRAMQRLPAMNGLLLPRGAEGDRARARLVGRDSGRIQARIASASTDGSRRRFS
jgi:hypothetical protein